ncbi:calcium permeable stress-gated cation channel 1-like [Paramacrobiotus metropolitanus]|uniref:calcium permeable stress-gated cation channel 1-like n=1 Tax=Paramacrobiotus metropolitanus TaxID=2943436 RepID=UPI0024458A40|nr:calcium permeable stress-gated cation channel 1-like [Paramacrobiotus metropolitanus]XP_055328538.1 calcium permeable stress-gated cation channel 1-like [Paramacrobiotus metropolitanus]XP_055328539.1 calcium permeable stress-gated cation channel 1-like [Paramacrobiotus metropolitanus]
MASTIMADTTTLSYDPETTTPGLNNGSCNLKPDGSRYPDPFGIGIGNMFAGIPQNMVINVILFAILLTVFVVLRKRGWGSAKIPLMGRRTNEWSSIFYGNRHLELSESATRMGELESPGSAILKQSPDSPEGYDVGILAGSPDGPDALSFWQWVRNAFLARDEFLLERSGTAALEYLRFQRHVIAFTAVLCIISIAIILPVNYRGTKQSGMNSSFPKTTINNVDASGDLLWVHIAFTMVLFPMGLLAMLSYGMKFGISKSTNKRVKTLMFYGLNPRITTEEKIRQHFEEAYHDCQVTAIFLTLNVSKLQMLDDELSKVNAALKFYEKTMSDRSEMPIVKNVACGFFCGCCVNGVNAVDFYQNKRAELERKIEEEIQSWKRTNTVFFVTFATEDQAYRVYQDYQFIFRAKPRTSVSSMIGAKHWTARQAPSAPFVSWENLSMAGWKWWLRAIAINTAVFLFFFFLGTPAVVLNALSLNKLDWFQSFASLPLISQFLPSLLLLTVAGLIPLFLYYTVRWTGYHTRSKEMRAEMKLLYAFLLITILIFPSLALTSLNIIVERFFSGKNVDIMWECAFLADNGAIFVNLMVIFSFVGAACQLLRLGQLFVFLCRYFCGSKSEAERNILLRTKTEFPFHEQYPDFLLTFNIVIVYCFVCPVITPFGLLAMCMKYLVDRYNLSYVFGKSDAPTSVHATAVNFFLVGLLMQNLLMIFFFVVRGGMGSMSGLLIAVLIINGLIYIGISWFGILKKVSLADEFTEDDIDEPSASPVGTPVKKARETYIPPVLQRLEARHISPVSNTVTSSTISA